MTKNREENKEKSLNNLVPFEKGVSGNPNGRPKGQRNYATVYREALIKLAEDENMTPSEIERELVANGIKLGIKGNFAFYKDVLDRLYGSAEKKEEKNPINIALILNSYDDTT